MLMYSSKINFTTYYLCYSSHIYVNYGIGCASKGQSNGDDQINIADEKSEVGK